MLAIQQLPRNQLCHVGVRAACWSCMCALSVLASSHLYRDHVCFVTGTGVTLLASMQCSFVVLGLAYKEVGV